MGILLNILSNLIIFVCSNICSNHFDNWMVDDLYVDQEITSYHSETGDFNDEHGVFDTYSLDCKCNSKIHAYHCSQGKCCYYNQIICCIISYEADKSPPYKA